MSRTLPPRALLVAAALLAMACAPRAVSAQIQVSGQVDLIGMLHQDTLGMNKAFRGDSPFNPVRLRLFARHWVNDRIGIFTELLFDFNADPRVNGAYLVVNDIAGHSWLNARVGLAPNVIGGFGLRSTYFNSNPLVGVPLVWQYRTNLDASGTATAASLAGTTSEPGFSLPVLYDSCWNLQWELLGEVGLFEYSLAMTPGSPSNPIKSMGAEGSTWMARAGLAPIPSVHVGVSGSYGPYLSKPVADGSGTLPYSEDVSDFNEKLIGVDLQYQGGPLVLTAEAYGVRYQAPRIDEELQVVGGYAEVRYDFLPGWYVAGRAGALNFGSLEVDATSGTRADWDQDTRRTELALGYRFAREMLVKADWQRTTVPDLDLTQNLFAIQLSTVF
jgi:hypothetical protein